MIDENLRGQKPETESKPELMSKFNLEAHLTFYSDCLNISFSVLAVVFRTK